MPNTNFQTFHQMGQAINEVVRQATGRDQVQNIDMDHVTVAQNHYYEDTTVTGRAVSFTDRVGGMPLEKCLVQIEPVQDLHGYANPWPGGAGKNILNCPYEGETINGVTITRNSDGTYSLSGTATADIGSVRFYQSDGAFLRPNTQYILSGNATNRLTIAFDNASISYSDTGNGVQFTTPDTWTNVWVYPIILVGDNTDGLTIKPMIRLATETDATYEPYSNICPITGWTGANIHVSPTTDAQDGTTYSITFPAEAGTVYGGTLDVTTGLLTVDSGVTMFDGDENWTATANPQVQYLPVIVCFPGANTEAYERVICSHLKMRDSVVSSELNAGQACYNYTGANWLINMGFSSVDALKSYLATNPMTAVYPLATPLTYQLTPQEITTILGVNNIWADTGDIEVKFKNLKELY